MRSQDALNNIKEALVVTEYVDGKAVSSYPILEEEVWTLQELVDKAVAKNTILRPYSGFDIEVAGYVACPMCNHQVVSSRIGYRPKYCPECGQALKGGQNENK